MDDLESIERAIAALEAQRTALGDDIVDTALRPLVEQKAAAEAAAAGEQRKLVTVLFADLVDFTVLSQALDAEDVRTVVNAYFRRWHQHIEAQGGVVEKFIGDAVMAVFGLHRAREDDPQRAIRAALAMRADLSAINEEVERDHGIRLSMRVGIDTGDVVVGTVGDRPGQELVVVGEVVNRASRLQGAAPVDGVLISQDSARHVRGIFGLRPVEGLMLKGIAEPVAAQEVLAERPRAFRLDGARGVEGVDTRTIGREIELQRLREHVADVMDERELRVVTIVGEAGIGKSRLLQELDVWLAEMPEPVWWFRSRASPSTANLPNALLRDMLAARFEIQDSDPPAAVRDKWEQGMAVALGDDAATIAKAHIVAAWLGFELGDVPTLAGLRHDPKSLSVRGANHLAEYLRALSDVNPVTILVEDLHWADESSLAWLDAAAAKLADRPVIVVTTARPDLFDRHPHWGEGHAHHVRLDLSPLSRRASRQLVAEIMQKADEVPTELTDVVVTAAEGNPFYIEELVKWLVEHDVVRVDADSWTVTSEGLATIAVPPTLKGVLQARLDGLPVGERSTLQRASVIGRVFWDHAVGYLTDTRDEAAHSPPPNEALERLRSREVVYQRELSTFDETQEYLFKHALLRDVTYESVLRAQRQRYHALAAHWLEQATARTSRTEEYAAVIAEHHDLANEGRAAAQWYLRAGDHAIGVHANPEALRMLTRGLEVAPESEVGMRFEMMLARETVLDRMGDREGQLAALAAMDELLDGLDDPARQSGLLAARARFAFHQSDYDDQERFAREAAELARQADLPLVEVDANVWLGKSLTWAGSHLAAREVFEQALESLRALDRPRVEAEVLRYLAIVANNLSEYERSIALLEQSRELFRADNDLEGESMALIQLGTAFYNQGRVDDARQVVEQALPVISASGNRYREAVTISNLATIVLSQGYVAEADELARDGLERCQALGDREGTATALGMLGDLNRVGGRTAESRRWYEECLDATAELHYDYLAADALCGLGLLALREGDPEAALTSFAAAMEAGRRASSPLEESRGRLGDAFALTDLGRFDEARTSFEMALRQADELDLPKARLECLAGLAELLGRRGQHRQAGELLHQVVPQLDVPHLEGTMDPGRTIRSCWRALAGFDDARADDVLRLADRWLQEMAARVGTEELRRDFLEGVPTHAELVALISDRGLTGDRAG